MERLRVSDNSIDASFTLIPLLPSCKCGSMPRWPLSGKGYAYITWRGIAVSGRDRSCNTKIKHPTCDTNANITGSAVMRQLSEISRRRKENQSPIEGWIPSKGLRGIADILASWAQLILLDRSCKERCVKGPDFRPCCQPEAQS